MTEIKTIKQFAKKFDGEITLSKPVSRFDTGEYVVEGNGFTFSMKHGYEDGSSVAYLMVTNSDDKREQVGKFDEYKKAIIYQKAIDKLIELELIEKEA